MLPRICTVDAGYLAKLVREPALDISLAPTWSPMSTVRFGATLFIFVCRYSAICFLLKMVNTNFLCHKAGC